MGACKPFKELASAVLNKARVDWRDPNRHDEVEAFLDGRLIDLYLDIAWTDKSAYLKSVRGQ
jgi:hypothetical protein